MWRGVPFARQRRPVVGVLRTPPPSPSPSAGVGVGGHIVIAALWRPPSTQRPPSASGATRPPPPGRARVAVAGVVSPAGPRGTGRLSAPASAREAILAALRGGASPAPSCSGPGPWALPPSAHAPRCRHRRWLRLRKVQKGTACCSDKGTVLEGAGHRLADLC